MMRKPVSDYKGKVTVSTPFFWKKCICCGNEFKNEPMYHRKGMNVYGCKTCFQSMEDFFEYYINNYAY